MKRFAVILTSLLILSSMASAQLKSLSNVALRSKATLVSRQIQKACRSSEAAYRHVDFDGRDFASPAHLRKLEGSFLATNHDLLVSQNKLLAEICRRLNKAVPVYDTEHWQGFRTYVLEAEHLKQMAQELH